MRVVFPAPEVRSTRNRIRRVQRTIKTANEMEQFDNNLPLDPCYNKERYLGEKPYRENNHFEWV
jgi:hypothetical protein